MSPIFTVASYSGNLQCLGTVTTIDIISSLLSLSLVVLSITEILLILRITGIQNRGLPKGLIIFSFAFFIIGLGIFSKLYLDITNSNLVINFIGIVLVFASDLTLSLLLILAQILMLYAIHIIKKTIEKLASG
ncbi:MAG: hypothetical protein Q6351_001125 [Candidatus Njordarchaeum guaymaensis]